MREGREGEGVSKGFSKFEKSEDNRMRKKIRHVAGGVYRGGRIKWI